MTSRKDRPKSAFTADERSLGGAHQILSDYASHYRRVGEAQPTRAILDTKKTANQSMAHRLSSNRAARKAAVSTSSIEHFSNIYHLNRRIEAGYSLTERRKDPYDPTLFPAYQKRGSNLYKSSMHASMLAWAPEVSARRPSTAPPRPVSARSNVDSYRGLSLTASLRDAFPSDDFPLRSSYRQMALDSIYTAYKRAIMAEIIENRMYREADLRELFRSYRRLAPLRDKDAVDRVVEDLKLELDVRGR